MKNLTAGILTSILTVVVVGTARADIASQKYVDDSIKKSAYTLPAATQDTLGGVKQGENVTIDEGGAISVDLTDVTATAAAAQSAAQTAQEKAESAEQKATNAESQAQQAAESVASAKSDADAAKASAEEAGKKATTAQESAQEAASSASQAAASASTASEQATAANTTAGEAKEAATAAGTKADEAKTTADAAKTTAEQAQQAAQNATTNVDSKQDKLTNANFEGQNGITATWDGETNKVTIDGQALEEAKQDKLTEGNGIKIEESEDPNHPTISIDDQVVPTHDDVTQYYSTQIGQALLGNDEAYEQSKESEDKFPSAKVLTDELGKKADSSTVTGMQSTLQSVQQTAQNAIQKPGAECGSAEKKCVLTYDGSTFTWEQIARGDAE